MNLMAMLLAFFTAVRANSWMAMVVKVPVICGEA
jgi:hypothetical protein